MYKIDFPIDAKEAAVIARRRRAEEERKLRIFNPRERIFGKDLKALEEQIQEKRDREQREKDIDQAWLRESQRQQAVIVELQRRAEADRKRVWLDVQEFRKECQHFEDRREFDLNDKRKLGYAARLHDEDVRNGPASMQKFEGEDLSYKGRIINQEIQKKAWLDAQIAEKKQNEKEYEEAHKIYEQRLKEMGLRTEALTRGENEARKAVEQAYRDYNLALAQEKAEQKKLEQLADEEATLAHQLNVYHSELLSEVTDVTSVNGPLRIGNDRFKGYTEEMIKTIKEEQLRQAMDKKRRDKEERSFDAAWEKMQRRYGIATSILDKEMDSRKRDLHIQLTNMNRELAEEQRVRQCYMNNMVFKGNVSEGFFDQFNTTTR